MGKLKNKTNGFSAVEVVLVLVIIGVIGIVGWVVYKNQHKTTTASVAVTTNTKATTQPAVDPYAGWKSYCSKAGACFKYPADWNPVTNGPGGPEPGNFKNPQQTLKIVSGATNSAAALTDPAVWYTGKIESLSTVNNKYKVWGGYLAAAGVYVPQYAVVDASLVGSNGLAVGQTKSTTDDTYISYTINGGTQHYSLVVFALSNSGFNKSRADAWFNSGDAKTALQIVQSLTFK